MHLLISSLRRPMGYYAGAGAGTSDFDPITAVNRTDGDGTIFMISSNSVMYEDTVDDPVFSAHKPVSNGYYDNETFYQADNIAGVLGCLEQVCRLRRTPELV
jgi:hypothetical protein